ncbi:hypothetical protein GGX14DRAFT_407605 [Mycena pura]|uniref:Uncharacterized protein n=1 Tax=Mycena pura TaxID=153505 RepID=A0AAD6UQU1_9AGAR|nr:hypothetical protein GGX14DRAFT_407605 [Mycena pura]
MAISRPASLLYKQEEEARNRCGSELSWKPFIPAVKPLTARGRCHQTNTRDPTADQEQAGQQLSFRRRSDHGTRAGDREGEDQATYHFAKLAQNRVGEAVQQRCELRHCATLRRREGGKKEERWTVTASNAKPR